MMSELVETKARQHHQRTCEKAGVLFAQPGLVEVDQALQTVELSNCNGCIARYRYSIDRQGRVRFK